MICCIVGEANCYSFARLGGLQLRICGYAVFSSCHGDNILHNAVGRFGFAFGLAFDKHMNQYIVAMTFPQSIQFNSWPARREQVIVFGGSYGG